MGSDRDYSHLPDSIRAASEQHLPVTIQWDLTWRCDHSCVHCYLVDRQQEELTLSEANGVLDQLADAGVFSILFSGGDPFLRPDAMDILRGARDRAFDVRINTHGNFIDDALADRLAQEVLPASVGISVYSIDPTEHDNVTRIPGSHAKSVAAVRRLVDRGINVRMKSPLMAQNRFGYHRVGELAEEIGADWSIDPNIIPDDESDFGLCGINAHSTERILANMWANQHASLPAVADFATRPAKAPTCGAGTISAHITPDGRLTPCVTWREDIGSLRTHSFAELWESEIAQRVRRVSRASYLQDCGGCGFQGSCSYCPGISHAETGDAGRRSEWVCERTHQTMAGVEYMGRIREANQPIPEPGSAEAEALFDGVPTFAERQWAARHAGMATQADELPVGLVEIHEPRRRAR